MYISVSVFSFQKCLSVFPNLFTYIYKLIKLINFPSGTNALLYREVCLHPNSLEEEVKIDSLSCLFIFRVFHKIFFSHKPWIELQPAGVSFSCNCRFLQYILYLFVLQLTMQIPKRPNSYICSSVDIVDS